MISRLVPDIVDLDISSPNYACLAYLRASAHYVLHLRDRVADYADADLSEFKAIVRKAPRNALITFNAAIKILAHKAKVSAPVCELNAWLKKAEDITAAVMAAADDFTSKLVLSRYYRAAAFLPQREGNRAEVIRVMDLAEQRATSMTPTGQAQELLYLENLHPVLESRTKEAIWLGDLDLALNRALRVTELDPYDPKPWLELGQVRLRRHEVAAAAEAYSVAAMLGPPATAIAHHMTGQCFRDLRQPAVAALFFKRALEVDPRAISPHDEIQALPDEPVLQALKKWSLASFEF
jgi:tetratricopeptide (TPR) repeat protein